ncbi:hypothetical protein BX600DRAFT_100986 [Xylariales sp. PMI_506]|nr:hypothetical protein BX600DRAFT_100986 [Xylariales sp. PMI_506]
MDQLIYDRLLEDSTFFAPAADHADHRAIEVSISSGSAEPQIHEKVLAEKQLAAWCRQPSVDETGGSLFRLLICSPRMADRDIWPLPLSSASLRSMLETLGIPPLFLRAVCRHIPMATLFECFDAWGRYGIMLRTNLTHTWQYALALTYEEARSNRHKSVTTAILFGLRGNETEEIVRSIRLAAKHFGCPTALPSILVDKALEALIRDAEERRKSLTQIRFETGSHGFARRQSSWRETEAGVPWDALGDDLDLDMLMQKLTGLSDACAGIASVCWMQHDFIGALTELQDRFDTPLPGRSRSSSSGGGGVKGSPRGTGRGRGGGRRTAATRKSGSTGYARQQLYFFNQCLSGLESKVTYTKSSVQDQVQTIYTLINLRESRSQMILAKTSRRLAELSRKDSTDMRVISAVTLVFLPATFTSTLFSASFFNFSPNDSAHISKWIWLYVVITIILTAAVLACWWFFSQRQHAKAMTASRRESIFNHRGSKQFELQQGTMRSLGRVDTPRPYLGGSLTEGIFAREVTLPPPDERKTSNGNISPRAIREP